MTSSDRRSRLEEVFFQAAALSETERSAFLHDACGDDTALRRDVEALIRADASADGETGGFLDNQGFNLAERLDGILQPGGSSTAGPDGNHQMADPGAEVSPAESVSFDEIRACCVEFMQEHQKQQAPSISDYLRRVSLDAQPPLLRNLLQIDLQYRRKSGQFPGVEEYSRQFPKHASIIRQSFLESTSVAMDISRETEETAGRSPLKAALPRTPRPSESWDALHRRRFTELRSLLAGNLSSNLCTASCLRASIGRSAS